MAIDIDSSVIARLDTLDPDRMRAARLAEPEIRDRLFALYAFHAELAKVPELVSEPMMGQIRYQWWRDCLDEIYSGKTVRQHEAAIPLAQMIEQTGLSRFRLDKIIDGRERDLDPTPFRNIDVARDYASATSGALSIAAVEICGGDAELGRNAGEAWGLCGLARSYRYYCDKVLSELDFEAILDATRKAHAEASASPALMPALAYVSLVPGFLKRMDKGGYNPREQAPSYAPFLKQLRMLRSVASGTL